MALCTVAYVRSKIHTYTLDDQAISGIIDETSEDVLALCETTDESNPLVILAGKYAILAAVLSRMKTTGELAASVKTGNSQRQNTTDADIERYEKKAHELIDKYTDTRSYSFSSPSFNYSFSNSCEGNDGLY